MPATAKRYAIWIAKLAVLAVVIWGGHRTIATALADLQARDWQLSQLRWGWAALCGACYLLSQLPSGWFWRSVLGDLRQRTDPLSALRAYFIGHLGKYVPGKAMVVVLRAGLLRHCDVKPVMAVVAVFYETLTTMACGAAVAAVLMLLLPNRSWPLLAAAFGLAIVVGLPTLPPAFSRLLRLTRVARTEPNLTAEPLHVSTPVIVRGWTTIAAGWFLAGASLWAALRAIGVEQAALFADWPLWTAVTALAVVLGFVSMLPAGVGVRDIALMQLLAPRLDEIASGSGETLAFVAVVVLRLVWLASELALAAVLLPLRGSKSLKVEASKGN